MNSRLRAPRLFALGMALLSLVGCDEPAKTKSTDASKEAVVKPPPVTEAPKPKGPPELSVDTLSPKVGFSRVLLQKPTDREKLKNELASVRSDFDGKEATITIERKADSKWVIAMLEEVAGIGASPIVIKTSSRSDFTQELRFEPQFKAGKVADCSVVTAVLADRSTAVWKLSGGTAARRGKGLGGPDLSMTGETLERYAKACKQSSTVFVSGAEGIEWGLIFDLAASTKKLEKVSFEHIVLLSEFPTAGRAVKL